MATIDLNERAKEIVGNIVNPYGAIKVETRGEFDATACLAAVLDKLTSAFAAKFDKTDHPSYPNVLSEEIFLVEAYIALLHFSATQGFILENMKVVGKNRSSMSAQIVDIANTLSKIGKVNQAISDHSLASRALNQILNYADRNDYDIERLYQMILQSQIGSETTRLAS